jgi:hypothetical protein
VIDKAELLGARPGTWNLEEPLSRAQSLEFRFKIFLSLVGVFWSSFSLPVVLIKKYLSICVKIDITKQQGT